MGIGQQRQRFVRAALELPQPQVGCVIGRIHQKLEAANTFDGNDRSGP